MTMAQLTHGSTSGKSCFCFKNLSEWGRQMRRSKLVFHSPLLIAFSLLISQPVISQSRQTKYSKEEAGRPLIWQNPGNISKRDLRYGPGSPRMAPAGPFTFVEENKSGESPKFVVRDARGQEMDRQAWTRSTGRNRIDKTGLGSWIFRGRGILLR